MRTSVLAVAALLSLAVAAPCPAVDSAVGDSNVVGQGNTVDSYNGDKSSQTWNVGSGNEGNSILDGILSPSIGSGNDASGALSGNGNGNGNGNEAGNGNSAGNANSAGSGNVLGSILGKLLQGGQSASQ
ncbi:uncharacterized protein JCM10292_005132 [Rhodotorula paludigena]|uniref:uncharacterized protein n=1 Tax=Rhodotorula paludigena TaxID=86838 RepID=UPI003177D173